MKWFFVFAFASFLAGCTDKNDAADAQRQKRLQEMYKTPTAPLDRSKDKGY